MSRVRHGVAGLSVYPALRVDRGPPERWIAFALDQRLTTAQSASGSGSSAEEAELDALSKLGVTPRTMRAAIAVKTDD